MDKEGATQSRMTPSIWSAQLIRLWLQIDIFSKDIIVFPINKNNVHWLCGAINFKDKRLECYDSMNPNGHAQVYEVGWALSKTCYRFQAELIIKVFSSSLQRLRRYLQAEHLDKKKTPIDLSDWVDYYDTVCLFRSFHRIDVHLLNPPSVTLLGITTTRQRVW
jgi:Ulp1 family protease